MGLSCGAAKGAVTDAGWVGECWQEDTLAVGSSGISSSEPGGRQRNNTGTHQQSKQHHCQGKVLTLSLTRYLTERTFRPSLGQASSWQLHHLIYLFLITSYIPLHVATTSSYSLQLIHLLYTSSRRLLRCDPREMCLDNTDTFFVVFFGGLVA